MDPELKILLVSIALAFAYCIAAGIPPVLIAWLMNQSAGRPAYNGYKVSKILSLLVGVGVVAMTLKKDDMDYPFWQPLIGAVLAYLFWNSRVPMFERTKESWLDEQRIYQSRKDKLNV